MRRPGIFLAALGGTGGVIPEKAGFAPDTTVILATAPDTMAVFAIGRESGVAPPGESCHHGRNTAKAGRYN